ncbi:MAG: hypothetical protein HOM58_20915 [Rhodospirillaceae bacterium]|nr:hypothetical protein [Rhodospirillaceae bacterium]MBT5455349.1 hypothetical protein [Rhodospirillaceae bacterium]
MAILFRKKTVTLGVVAGVLILGIYSVGLLMVAQRIDVPGITRLVMNNAIYVPANMARSFFASPERLTIDIKHKHILKLEKKRRAALRRRYLLRGEDDYVPARIRHGDNTVDVKLRLKGELPDHYRGKKWSLRVVTKNNGTLFGMKRFSLQSPRTRYYLYEWVFQKMMAREGLMALRYDFVDVTLNGKHMGIYAIEEHFEDQLVKNNGRPGGPIVFYSDAPDSPRYNLLSADPRWRADMQAGPVDVYRKRRTFADPARTRQFNRAKDRMEAFRRGELPACDVFNCKQMGRWLALLDLTSGRHNARHGNLKFFFNPATDRLEPIAYDGSAVGVGAPEGGVPAHLDSQVIMVEDWFVNRRNEPFYMLLQDQRLFQVYMNELGRLSQRSYLDDIFATLGEELEQKLRVIHRDYPHFRFDRNFFYKRQNRIRKYLRPPTGIVAYLNGQLSQTGLRQLDIGIASIVSYPLQITTLRVNGALLPLASGEPFTLLPFIPLSPMNVQDVRFSIPEGVQWPPSSPADIRVGFRTWGGGKLHWTPALPWAHRGSPFRTDLGTVPSFGARKAAYMDVDSRAATIKIKRGNWKIAKDLVFPPDHAVTIEAGTHIRLVGGARIVSYSPVTISGRASAPVIIEAADTPGSTFMVIRAKSASTITHASFHRLGGPRPDDSSVVVAGVTFYRAPVTIKSSQFTDSRGPAALQIIGENFRVSETAFDGAAADAVNVSGSQGFIKDVTAKDIFQDAIALSGSRVELRRSEFQAIGGTAVRLTHSSDLTADSVIVRNAGTAIASRNGSRARLAGFSLSKLGMGFSVDRDRSKFGAAELRVSASRMDDVEQPFRVGPESALYWNGHRIGVTAARPKPLASVQSAVSN